MTLVHSSLNHPLRVPLAAEVHSRPFLRLAAPESLTHLAVYASEGLSSAVDGDNFGTQHAILLALCGHFGVAGPSAAAKYFFHDFGRFRLKWECHTEFATYTFAQHQPAGLAIGAAFDLLPLQHIPQLWLHSLRGKLMVAAHLALQQGDGFLAPSLPAMGQLFENSMQAGSQVLQGGEIWTDFVIQADGFTRFLVRDIGLQDQQAGRLVQRMLEIETYRMMALLGLPHAQRAAPILNAIEGELAKLTAALTDKQHGILDMLPDEDGEQALLNDIIGLAARIEKLSLENSYRFSASQAYFRLVQARIDELRELRVEGVPTIGEFMERRLAPAMDTCVSIARRQEALAERIAHTNDLLRTRVGIVQEQQNRKILESLNKRAAQQLLLQQAVEGLSVVAISYYLAGLVNYVGKAASAAGWPVNPDMATGIMIPVIVGCVWWGLSRVHLRLDKHNGG